MASARSSGLLREVRTLFGVGAVAGLSDAQLLERFRTRSAAADEAARDAEAAFEALVARHGPMVLGVCRRALADPAGGRRRLPGHVPRAGAPGGRGPGG